MTSRIYLRKVHLVMLGLILAFLLTTELLERTNQIVLLGWPTGALVKPVRMSIYGQCRLHSNPADVCKSTRKARNVTRRGVSIDYIRLGTRLTLYEHCPTLLYQHCPTLLYQRCHMHMLKGAGLQRLQFTS